MNPGIPAIPEQDFFTMGEACRIAQVPAHSLRYWEAKLGFPRPARRASGHRRYCRGDLETVFEIKRLLRDARLTMAGARKALLRRQRGAWAEPDSGAASPAALRLLREARAELKELAAELAK